MKSLIFTVAIMLALSASISLFAQQEQYDDEVTVSGLSNVPNPKRPPLFISDPDTYWKCEGLVDKDVISAAHSLLVGLSIRHGIVAPPLQSCYYVKSSLLGVNMYTLDFYLSEAERVSWWSNAGQAIELRQAMIETSGDAGDGSFFDLSLLMTTGGQEGTKQIVHRACIRIIPQSEVRSLTQTCRGLR